MEFTGNALNGYRLLEPIGYYGSSILYKASASSREKYVAIKVFPSELSRDRQILERMRASFQDLNRINHPGIPPVMKFSISEGFPYIVFPYMAGGSLEDRIAFGALAAINAEKIIKEAASALDKAHSKGLVHGNLDPSQILFDENGKAQVIGIGEASIFRSPHDSGEESGDGWFDYRAPEVKNGRPITPSADQYSLGLIALQLLARTPVDQALQGLEFHLQNGNGYRTRPNHLVLALPSRTIEVLARALSINPSDRFPSIKAMIQALEGSIWKDKTPTAVSPVQEKPATKKQNHNRLLVFAVAAIIVLCLFALEPALSMQGGFKFGNLLSTIGLKKSAEITDNGSNEGGTTEAISIIVLPTDKNTAAPGDGGIQLTDDSPTQGTDETEDATPDPGSTPVPTHASYTSTPTQIVASTSTATLVATSTKPQPTPTLLPPSSEPTIDPDRCSRYSDSDWYCTRIPEPTIPPSQCSRYHRSDNYCTPVPGATIPSDWCSDYSGSDYFCTRVPDPTIPPDQCSRDYHDDNFCTRTPEP